MNREVLDRWCERGILLLVLGILIFGPLATGAVRVQDFLVLQALTLGVMALWGLRLWIKPRPQLLWPPICWAVVVFAIYAVVRYLTADIEYVARFEMVQVLVYAFLFLAILNNLHRQESAQIISFTLIFLAMAISAYAIYQFATGSDKVWTFVKPYKHRGTGTFISPNNLGGFLEMIIPLGLAWALVSRAKVVTKIFVGYASLVMLAGVVVSVSRGSWLSTGIALAFFFAALVLHRTYRLPAVILLVLLVAGGIFVLPRNFFLKARFREVISEGKMNDDARFSLWKPAVQLWKENIWWGIGPAHFDYRFGKYRPETVQVSPDRVHNDYLNALTDYGIVGAMIVAAALALLFAGVIKTWSFVRGSSGDFGGRRSNKFALVLGASMGLLAVLIHSLVDFNMHIPANAILGVTLMALLSGCLRFATERYWKTVGLGLQTLVTITLATGLIYLSWQGTRAVKEHLWIERAQKAEEASPEKIAALQNAFSIEPRNGETAHAIGEAFRLQSWRGTDDYKDQALEAMKWFQRGTELNPYDDSSFLRYGMCLDQIDRHDEAMTYFDKAMRMDPNSYFNTAFMGWHYMRTGDYAAARVWFERSRRLEWQDNPVADRSLPIVRRRMLEEATNSSFLNLPRR